MNKGLIDGVEMAIDCGYKISKRDYEEYLKITEEKKMKKEVTVIATAEITFIKDREGTINKKQLEINIKHMTGADDVHVIKVQEFIMEENKMVKENK